MSNGKFIAGGSQGRLALAILASGLLNPMGSNRNRVLTAPKQRSPQSAEESCRRINAAQERRERRRAKRHDNHVKCKTFDGIDRSRQGIPSGERHE